MIWWFSVGVNAHRILRELVNLDTVGDILFEYRFNPRPVFDQSGKHTLIIDVAQPYPYHPRRASPYRAYLLKIGVLGHDHKIVFQCEPPNGRVGSQFKTKLRWTPLSRPRLVKNKLKSNPI